MDIITVKSALPGNRVALWDTHPAHPGGEVFVVGEREVKVALVHSVRVALAEKRVVEVVKKQAKKKPKPTKEAAGADRAAEL